MTDTHDLRNQWFDTKTKMTEIQKTKKEIEVLQEKLQKLEAQEPKMTFESWGDCDMVSYNHKYYYRLSFGKGFAYWYKRVIGSSNLMRVDDPEEHNLVEELYNGVILDSSGVVEETKEYPYKVTDKYGESNPYKQYLNSVEDEKSMEELGFVKNSDGNWTAQPLVETEQKQSMVSSVDKPKPDSLYDLIADWWDEIFTNGNPSGQNIESLVEEIMKLIPEPISDTCGFDEYVIRWRRGYNYYRATLLERFNGK